MVYARPSGFPYRLEQSVRADSHPWNRWVSLFKNAHLIRLTDIKPWHVLIHAQLHLLVLLRRSVAQDLRRRPPHDNAHKLLRLPHLRPIPMHAAAAPPRRIRLPRHRAPRRRAERVDER